jgi:hypothetical protein
MEEILTNIENNISKNSFSNKSIDKYFQQSTKINNKINRPLTGRLRHHYFLDNSLNKDKHCTLSKGTNFEKQFKRYTKEELIKILGPLNKRAGNMNKNKKKIIKKFLGETKIKINFDKAKQEIKKSLNQEVNKNNKKLNIKINEPNNIDIISTLNKNKSPRPFSSLTTRKGQDKYLPKGYIQYEYRLLNSLHKNKEKTYNIKDVKQKAHESDIFFLKGISQKESQKSAYNDKAKFFNTKLGSDIFNLKKDLNNLMKSGELYLFKTNKIPFSSESKSFWASKVSTPSYMNHPSVEYNILNPSVKNNMKTKEQIYKESIDNKLLNPIYRQKGIGLFYDITKVGTNKNLAYNKLLEENRKVFYKNNDTCTSQYDTYKNYQGLIPKPFITQHNKNVYV